MGLESGSFLDDLVASNPSGTESKSQGDDHIRLIKSLLRATFIGATRAFHFPAAPAAKTSNYTIVLTDQNALIRGNATSGELTLTLPLGSVVFSGYEVTIMKSDSSSNDLTVDGNGSETINGTATRTLEDQYLSETYRWEGSEWKVVATFTEMAQLTVGDGLEESSGNLQIDLEDTSISLASAGIKRESLHARKTADYTAVAADNGTFIEMDKASAVTLNLTAAATLADGWFIDVNNSGAGTLTIDPDGSELIDDAATLDLTQNRSVRVVCDGSAFWTVGRGIGLSTFVPGFTSSETSITADTLHTFAHSLSAFPSLIQVVVKCSDVSGDTGYANDEEIILPLASFVESQHASVSSDATNVYVVVGLKIVVIDKSTFNSIGITLSKWKLLVRAWL